MPPPTTFGVVAEREIYIAREATPGTIPAAVGVPIPMTTFKPSDTPLWIKDESWQGSMGGLYGVYQGPLIAGLDLGGYVFPDTFGHLLLNILGDLTSTGTAASPAGTTNAGVAVGALALPVASGGASFTQGMYVWIEDAGTPVANEVCLVGSGSTGTSVVLAAPGTRFAHLTATPFTNTTAPYTHVNAVLNGSIGAPNGPAQPWTHCLTDRTGLPANAAAQYAYVCLTDLTITGNTEKLLEWTAKAVCAARVPAAAAVGFANTSAVATYPSWRSVTGVAGPASGGTQIKDIAEWEVTITRQVKAFNTDQGSQQPYVIARGKQDAAGKNTILPAIDESALIAMLANTQPQLEYLAANGLGGALAASLQIDVGLGAYSKADLTDGDILFGYDVPWDAVHNPLTGLTGPAAGTMTGASGGKGAVKIALQSPTPTF